MTQRAVYGNGVSFMYGSIVDGRRAELALLNLRDNVIADEMDRFIKQIKYIPKNDFIELYNLYNGSPIPAQTN